jgi:hypothetical protein
MENNEYRSQRVAVNISLAKCFEKWRGCGLAPSWLEELKVKIAASTFLFVWSAVAGWGQTVKTDEQPADTLIVLERGACEHRCAVYNVIIFADGSAIFDGRHYVRRPGVVRTRISLEALGKLLDEAAALRFFDLKDRYAPGMNGCDSMKSDAPSAVISISSGGKSKTVVHYHGCGGSESDRLIQFEASIDKAVNTVRWVK